MFFCPFGGYTNVNDISAIQSLWLVILTCKQITLVHPKKKKNYIKSVEANAAKYICQF